MTEKAEAPAHFGAAGEDTRLGTIMDWNRLEWAF
jgi:hypothetical protein